MFFAKNISFLVLFVFSITFYGEALSNHNEKLKCKEIIALPNARVVEHMGHPVIKVNDEILSNYFYSGPDDEDQWRKLAKAGYRVFYLKVDIKNKEIQNFEFERVLSVAKRLLYTVPDAYIIFRVGLLPTSEFSTRFPEECMAWEGNEIAPYDPRKKWYLDHHLGKYSLSSERWRKYAGEKILEFVDFVHENDIRKHVIGYFLAGGYPGEWNFWPRPKYLIDFSPAMENAFRKFIYKKYSGDTNLLRASWNDNDVTFFSVKVPGRKERDIKGICDFIVPENNQKTLDYLECHNGVVSDTLIYLSQIIKKATEYRSLVGFFYGYLQYVDYKLAGQTNFKKALACPTIDFFTSPPPYENRDIGHSTVYRFPYQSFMAHHKVFVSEDDIRTHSVGPSHIKYGKTKSIEESLEVLKRSFTKVMVNGNYAYWFEMDRGWYNDPKILELFKRMQIISEALKNISNKSISEIAVVVDQESLWCSPQEVNRALLDRLRIHSLPYLGTSYDYWELSDFLMQGKQFLSRYKLVLFLNLFHVDSQERKMINNFLKNNNRHLVWFYAPGLIKSKSSLDNMQELTGFHFILNKELRTQRVICRNNILGNYDEKLTSGETLDWKATPQKLASPRIYGGFAVDDANATIMGTYENTDKVGFAKKIYKDYTSYFIGSLMTPANVLRKIALDANCHLYQDGDDVIYSSDKFLGIHATDTGIKTIKLPSEANVYDVFDNKWIAVKSKKINLNLSKNETKLLFICHDLKVVECLKNATEKLSSRERRISSIPQISRVIDNQYRTFNLNHDGFVSCFQLSRGFYCKGIDRTSILDYNFIASEYDDCLALDGNLFIPISWDMPIVNLDKDTLFVSTLNDICYYVAFYLMLDKSCKLSINIGSDDGYKLLFNSKEIGRSVEPRGVEIDNNKHIVMGHRGANLVILKIQQGGGGTGFCIRILDPQTNCAPKGCKVLLRQKVK